MLKLSELRSALADKANLQRLLDEASANLAARTEELRVAQDSAAAEKSRADDLQSQIDAANATIDELNGKVAAAAGEKKTVSQAAIEKLHELGVPAAELPAAATPGQTDADLLAEYAQLTGREKTMFFRTHRDALRRAVDRN